MKKKNPERGSLLIASVLVILLVLTGIIQYGRWISQASRVTVQRLASQKASANADSGIQAALQFLRSPSSSSLTAGTTVFMNSLSDGATYYLQFVRHVIDPSIVDVYSFGYYRLPKGAVIDPTGQPAQQTVVRAQVQLRSLGDYFAASPGTLAISKGSNINNGIVYGKDLVFVGSGPSKAVVKAAYYANSLAPVNYGNYVTVLDAPFVPVKVSVPPVLPELDIVMQNKYEAMAGPDVWSAGQLVSGNVNSPAGNTYKVYYSSGDVTLGDVSTPTTINGSFVLYSAGDIHIGNSIQPVLGGSAWPVLIANGNIYIDSTAPSTLNIYATVIANNEFKALGPSRGPGSTLTLTGGIVSGAAVTIAGIYANRNYAYQAPDPSVALPSSTQIITYNTLEGKYN